MVKKVFALFCILLMLPVQTYAFDRNLNFDGLYRKHGIYVERGDGGTNSSSGSDGGSGSSSGGTHISAADTATYNAQQDIRKDFKSIIERIKKNNFAKILNNGQTSIYAGKTTLKKDEMDNIIKSLNKYQKKRKKADYGDDFNTNDKPRSMKNYRAPKMTKREKKKAQREIVKQEKIKTTGKSSSKNAEILSVSKEKINLNSPITTNSYDPPSSKSKTYVKDIIDDGIRDYPNWDARIETLRNYIKNKNSTEGETGKNVYTFLRLLAQYHIYIKDNYKKIDYGYPYTPNFNAAKNLIAHGRRAKIQCMTPYIWALHDMGIKNASGNSRVHATAGGGFSNFSGDMKKYLRYTTVLKGKSIPQAMKQGLFKPGDIVSKNSNQHGFAYSGYKTYTYDGGREGKTHPPYFNDGIFNNYNNYHYQAGAILRWKSMDNASSKKSKIKSKKSKKNKLNINMPWTSSMNNDEMFNPANPAFALEDFEDVAYVESYTLTAVNRHYYKVSDYTSDKLKYELLDKSGEVIKSGTTDTTELHFDDISDPGQYKLKWWQWAKITTGITVGYLKRQYLVLLPSNTILYYKEEFCDETPVFIEKHVNYDWVYVDAQQQTIKDVNAIDNDRSITERIE